jgi:UDP-glucose 4-epimerase
VAIFAGNLVAGRPCVIFGDGSQTRDYVYVDDVVDAFARAARRGDGLVLNIGTGQETSVSRLYEIVAAAASSDLEPRHEPARPGELKRSALDPRRAALHMGWKPWTSIETGIASVVRYIGQAGS